MSPHSKEEYFEAIHKRYKEASRKEKTNILDEYCAICVCHRKHAIRRGGLRKPTTPQAFAGVPCRAVLLTKIAL